MRSRSPRLPSTSTLGRCWRRRRKLFPFIPSVARNSYRPIVRGPSTLIQDTNKNPCRTMHPGPVGIARSARNERGSDQLAHAVFDHVLPCDLAPVGFASRQCLGELERLLGFDFARHRSSEGIDYGFNDHGAVDLEGFVENVSAAFRIFDGEAVTATCARVSGEVDGMQLDPILGITQKNH